MDSFTTEEIITGLRFQKTDVLGYIYNSCFPGVRKFVLKSGGNEDDAKDCFQESLVIVYRKIKEDQNIIINSFPDYIFGICRHIFLKQKNNGHFLNDDVSKYSISDNSNEPDDAEIQKNYEYRLYQTHFNKLGEVCRKILGMILQKIPVKQIAEMLKTTETYIHTRKYKCKEQLISNIKGDPAFGKKYYD
ncbi:MAG: RNA polymerase sigma factor [Bacteroidales bacterium]